VTAPGSPAPAASTAHSLPADLRGGNASLLDRIRPIWRISGQVELPPGHSPSGAIDQLEPLFDAVGTRYERSDEGLIFTKKDPAAQDKLAVFDAGILHIADDGSGRSLRYTLNSRIMLACFLAPLLFLGFAQVTLATGAWEKAAAEAEKKTKPDKKKKDGGKEFVLNPIDVALGAPAPRTKKEMAALKAEKEKEPPSATPAFVFAGMFAALYVIGRILEAQRVNALFRKALQSP
jgi:hypothetical protein